MQPLPRKGVVPLPSSLLFLPLIYVSYFSFLIPYSLLTYPHSQRAADQAESLNTTLAAHYQNAQAGIAAYKGKGVELGKEAQAKVYALSHGVVAELEKIQVSRVDASYPLKSDTATPTSLFLSFSLSLLSRARQHRFQLRFSRLLSR